MSTPRPDRSDGPAATTATTSPASTEPEPAGASAVGAAGGAAPGGAAPADGAPAGGADTGRPGTTWPAVALLGLLGLIMGVAGIFYLPWWVGTVPVPWIVLVVGWFTWWAPRRGHRLTGSVRGAAVPILTWFVVTAWLSLARNGLYGGFPVAVQDWRLYLLVGVGVLVSAWGLGGIWARAVTERAAQERAARAATSPTLT